jgi:hypothetical protein
MTEVVRTSETSVNFNVTTRRYVPEDSKLHTRRRENMKCHKAFVTLKFCRYGDAGKCQLHPASTSYCNRSVRTYLGE